ncbi:unnamed protein product, partial [Darwinula stevensoni]
GELWCSTQADILEQGAFPEVTTGNQSSKPTSLERKPSPAEYRFILPEFLPDPKVEWRNKIREKLERADMLKRRKIIDIPEFYVGSILAVTVSDPHAPGKMSRFLGLCTERGGCGLRAYFVLRNVIDGQGVEVMYEMYNPTIQSVEVIRLEKRLDENLRYLRDCPSEFSTFPQDMEHEILPPGSTVPLNTLKVPLTARTWSQKWQYWNLKGVEPHTMQLEYWQKKKYIKTQLSGNVPKLAPWHKYELMEEYRSSIPEEEQVEMYSEVLTELGDRLMKEGRTRRRRTLVRPRKTA